MAAWADIEFARLVWADAPLDDALLQSLLDSAQESCEAYAPASTDPVPDRYSQAVVLQAQEVYNATSRDGDVIGFSDSGYAVRVRPLSTTVKALLRPRTAVPKVR